MKLCDNVTWLTNVKNTQSSAVYRTDLLLGIVENLEFELENFSIPLNIKKKLKGRRLSNGLDPTAPIYFTQLL